MESDFSMPLLHEYGKKTILRITWKGETFVVERVLKQRVSSIVLLVRFTPTEYRIIKLYPHGPPHSKDLLKHAYRTELHAYRRIREGACPAAPRFYGSSLNSTLIYPLDCKIPASQRLCGEQKAIMLEFLDGRPLSQENYTADLGRKALQSLKLLHGLRICHNDINDLHSIQNAIVSRDGEVKWIDFERSHMDSDLTDCLIPSEWQRAVEFLGPGGRMGALQNDAIKYLSVRTTRIRAPEQIIF